MVSNSLPSKPNHTIHAKNGWRYEKRVTAMMVEDMLFDPILACKVLLGIDVPPHQQLRLLVMWTHGFTIDDSGFSTGKSFTFGAVAAIRSILMPNRTTGVISNTFRQGKLIFDNFDNWYESSKIFRNCVKHKGGKARLVHESSAWHAHFRGGSEIRVLPPSFFNNNESIRGERWNDGMCDEWTVFANLESLMSTIVGRITKVNHFPDCPVRQNHIHFASTPNYEHHPSYKIVKQMQSDIDDGDDNCHRFTSNYRHIPETDKWRWIVALRIINIMQRNNSEGKVKAEIDGLWSKDSGSYYGSKIIEDARLKIQTIRGYDERKQQFIRDETKIYIGGFDCVAGTEERNRLAGDDFALSVLETNHELESAKHVFTFRITGAKASESSSVVLWAEAMFRMLGICFDSAGGGNFVRDELQKGLMIFNRNGIIRETKETPLLVVGGMNTILGKQNLTPFKRKSMLIDLAWGKMASDSVIVNKAHNELKSMLESGVIKVSPEWNGWINLDLNNRTHDDKRKFLNENGHSMNVRDRIMAEMDIAVEQLLNVDIVRDSDKMAKTDKFGMFKFKSSGKKDSAYSLLYASAMFSVLRELKRKGMSMIVEEFSGSSQNNFSPAAGIISELGDEREARSMRGVKKEGIE